MIRLPLWDLEDGVNECQVTRDLVNPGMSWGTSRH